MYGMRTLSGCLPGLRGGHSGLNIIENRGNAIKLTTRVLLAAIDEDMELDLVSIDGGDKLAYESNNRTGITFAVPLGSRFSLKLVGTTGVTSTAGNDYDTITAALQTTF